MVTMETGWAELGVVIRNHRKDRPLTQEQLAERAGSHWTYVSEIENGHRNPSIGLLRRIASGLNMSLAELIAEAELVSKQAESG